MYCTHPSPQLQHTYHRTRLYYCPACHLTYSSRKAPTFNSQKLYRHYYHNQVKPGRFRFGLELVIKAFRLFRALKIYTIVNLPQLISSLSSKDFTKGGAARGTPKKGPLVGVLGGKAATGPWNSVTKTILDIGSGRGYQLYYLKKYFGYTRAVGTQLDPAAYHFSKHHLDLEIYPKDLLKLRLKPKSFHIISLWHVLEHLEHPEKYFNKIRSLLTPGGTLIIEVPNLNSWTSRLTNGYWLGLDLKYHLYFFTTDSLTRLLTKYHFKIRSFHTFSLEYSTFISVSSLVSRLTHTDHLIFAWVQGKRIPTSTLITHLTLFVLLTPICFLINLALYYSNRGEVLLITATKTS